MRTLCEACECAAAILFCAADEAALCSSCDEKVHTSNKIARSHVRVGLSDPNDVQQCDACKMASAFFYCEVDGTYLCLQCDMLVHVGGKRTHARYLLSRQRVEFPLDKPDHLEELGLLPLEPNHRGSTVPLLDGIAGIGEGKIGNRWIDLNAKPQDMDVSSCNCHDSGSVVTVVPFKRVRKMSKMSISGSSLAHVHLPN